MAIREATAADIEPWLAMRLALWPEYSREDLLEGIHDILGEPARNVGLVFERDGGGLIGFLEAGIRRYADGCDTKDVGYIEGWFVEEGFRRQGIGRQLVEAAENWARGKGCREMASDCLLANDVSATAHGKLGYQQVERLIHFRKGL